MNNLPSLSNKEALVMELLVTLNRELYALELARLSKGKLRPGTIYVTVGRLVDKGFIEGREDKREDTGMRRMYKPTASGQRVYHLLQQAQKAATA